MCHNPLLVPTTIHPEFDSNKLDGVLQKTWVSFLFHLYILKGLGLDRGTSNGIQRVRWSYTLGMTTYSIGFSC